MPYAPLEDAVLESVQDTIEHFNANHADTVLLLARHAAGVPDASDAEALTVDTAGVDFQVVAARLTVRARAEFATSVTTAAEVTAAVMTLVGAARSAAPGDYPLTSLEREFAQQRSIPTHHAHVQRIAELTPNLREVVIGGPGLAAYRSLGGDQFVYLLVARPGAELPGAYSMAEWMAADPATRPRGAYYTTRSWDPARGELTLWAVVHGHHDGVGGWLTRCAPGDRLALWGPRDGFWSDAGYDCTDTEPRHHLFVTDESGFAAVAAIVDGVAAGDSVTVLAETVDAAHTIGFPGARTDVRWHYRGDTEPGTGTGLLDLVTDLVGHIGTASLSTAFGAGESRQMSRIRSFLRHEAGLPAVHVSMTGYWRRRV